MAIKQRSNSAKQKLGEQPFRTVTEKKEFVDRIRRHVLARLETSKAMEEYTNQDEYKFFKQKFQKGMFCRYGTDRDHIVHVSLSDKGIQIEISESAKESKNQNELDLVGQLVKSMSNSLVISYFEAMGYLRRDPLSSEIDPDIHPKPSPKKK